MKRKFWLLLTLVLAFALSTSIVWANDNAKETKPAIKVGSKVFKVNDEKVTVPKVEGIKDKELRNLINDNIVKAVTALKNLSPDSSLTGDSHIISITPKLLVFHFSGNSFTKGTAHPNKIDKGIHVNLTNGKIYTLEDLFMPEVDINMVIKKICLTNFDTYRAQEAGLNNDWTYKTFIDSWRGDDRSFILYPDHIRVYSIPNYAMGPIAGYNIPYSDLTDVLNTQGDLWQALLNDHPEH